MTINELEKLAASGNLFEHHSASRRGYISRRTAGKVEAYSGRFGNGYIATTPRWDTTQYVTVTYYIGLET